MLKCSNPHKPQDNNYLIDLHTTHTSWSTVSAELSVSVILYFSGTVNHMQNYKLVSLKWLCDVLKLYNITVNNVHAIMRNVHAQYMQRWCHLYSQASEQSSDTNAIKWQVIVDSTCNVTILSENNLMMC